MKKLNRKYKKREREQLNMCFNMFKPLAIMFDFECRRKNKMAKMHIIYAHTQKSKFV